jgi:multidrug efflux pump subunit AcrA (membrane-fusion protein)
LLPIVFILIGIALYTLLIFFKQEAPSIQTKIKVWPVQVIQAKLQAHTPVLTVYGVVENPGTFKMTAAGASYITQLPVREGQVVQQNDLLVALDQRDFLPKLHSAEALVSSVKAQLANLKLRHSTDASMLQTERKMLELKQLELSRTQLLLQRQLGSQVAVDLADQAFQQQKLAVAQRQFAMQEYPYKTTQLRAQLTQAIADVDVAGLQLERSRMVAESDALVGRIDIAVGDQVQQNQLLFSVYPFHRMQVRAKIPASAVSAVQSALSANSADANQLLASVDGHDVELALMSLAGEADARGVDALLTAKTNAQQLRKGMALTVYLNLPEQTQTLAIPYQALYGVDRAYKVVNGKLQGIALTRLGDVQAPDGVMWALVKSSSLVDGDLLVTTHLPNAVNGLIVEPKATHKK